MTGDFSFYLFTLFLALSASKIALMYMGKFTLFGGTIRVSDKWFLALFAVWFVDGLLSFFADNEKSLWSFAADILLPAFLLTMFLTCLRTSDSKTNSQPKGAKHDSGNTKI